MQPKDAKKDSFSIEREYIQKLELLKLMCGELNEKFLPKNYPMLRKLWTTMQNQF